LRALCVPSGCIIFIVLIKGKPPHLHTIIPARPLTAGRKPGDSCLQAHGSAGNWFYSQEAPCSEFTQNPFLSHFKLDQRPCLAHSEAMRNSSWTHSEHIHTYSEFIPNSGRIRSRLILNCRRTQSELTLPQCIHTVSIHI